MADRLDIIVFGATGFTGMHCIPYVAKLSKQDGRSLSWGVAGRSEEKLKEALKKLGDQTEINFDSVPVIVADIKSHESLLAMAKRARLVINCVGPYWKYGEVVVKACIEAGTHHVDVSGEAEYMEKMQLEYHDAAVEKGVYAVSACGIDSVPVDLGTLFVENSFEGTLNSVKTYLTYWIEGPAKGPALNIGTWETVVNSAGNMSKLKDIRRRFYQKFQKAPTYKPKLSNKVLPHRPAFIEGWALPFVGCDGDVARRTQDYLYQYENKRPIQVGTYMVVPSFGYVLKFLFIGTFLSVLSLCQCGRRLLVKYASTFSGGYFTHEQPAEETVQNTWFSLDLHGEGWNQELADKDEQPKIPCNKTIRCRIKGRNPVYGVTCFSLVLAGIVILTEREKLANKGKGGIYSPGAAFANTSFIKQLSENGVSFKVISD